MVSVMMAIVVMMAMTLNVVVAMVSARMVVLR